MGATRGRNDYASSRQAGGITLLADVETGRRNRRAIDGAVLLAAAVVAGLTAAVASSAKAEDSDVARAAVTVFGWAESFWRVSLVGLLGFALVVVVDVFLRRRWGLARDLLAAALLVLATGGCSCGASSSPTGSRSRATCCRAGVTRSSGSQPRSRVLVVAGPELVRWARLLATWLVPFAMVGAVVLGAALPSAALGALALGLGAGAIVRLVFGSAAGVPPTAQVRDALTRARHRGTRPERLRSGSRSATAEYVGHDADGRPLKVRVLGRDAQDTQRLARRWRLARLSRSAEERPGRPPRAGRARGAGDSSWPRRRGPGARGRQRRTRPRRRRAGRHPTSRTSTRSSSPTRIT